MGGRVPWPPSKGLTKMEKMAQFAAFCIIKKNFPRGHTPQFGNLLCIFGARRHWPPPMRLSGAACAKMEGEFDIFGPISRRGPTQSSQRVCNCPLFEMSVR